ncbi:MAG: hypothetical protein WBV39_11850 [Rudaea sp.]
MLSPMPIVALTCCLMVLGAVCLRRIPEGHAYTLRRVGGHMRTVGAGIHLVWPLIERVAHKIRLLGNEVEVAAHAPSGDISGRVYFQVIDAQRADALIDDIADLLRRRIPELTAGSCNETDPAMRDAHLKTELNRDLRERGVLITRVQMQ